MKLERLKGVNESAYNALVDQTAKRYRTLKEVNGAELKGLVADMKAAWADIRKELKSVGNGSN